MAAYKQGEFCWWELGTRDIAAAVKFYTELMDWGTVVHDMGEHGKYYIFQLEGRDMGGGYQMSGPQFEGVPPHWMPYIWVDDVDATAARAVELGGKIVAPPMEAPDVGRMAFLQDLQGAHFAIFLGREHRGAARLAKPGEFAWTELRTPDSVAARQFYCPLLGWTFVEQPMERGMTYTVFQVDGKPAAGMMKMAGPEFQGVPPHWGSFLSVADCDSAAARVAALGGKILVPPSDVPGIGRFSAIQDPTGASLCVMYFIPM